MLRPGQNRLPPAFMKLQDPGAVGESPPAPQEVSPALPTGFGDTPVPGEGTGLTIASCRTDRLGAEVLEDGVRFAVYSEHARRIYVALFPPGTPEGGEPADVLPLPDRRSHVFMGF